MIYRNDYQLFVQTFNVDWWCMRYRFRGIVTTIDSSKTRHETGYLDMTSYAGFYLVCAMQGDDANYFILYGHWTAYAVVLPRIEYVMLTSFPCFIDNDTHIIMNRSSLIYILFCTDNILMYLCAFENRCYSAACRSHYRTSIFIVKSFSSFLPSNDKHT